MTITRILTRPQRLRNLVHYQQMLAEVRDEQRRALEPAKAEARRRVRAEDCDFNREGPPHAV